VGAGGWNAGTRKTRCFHRVFEIGSCLKGWTSEEAGLFQGGVCAILVHGFEGAAAELEADVLAELGDPDALGLKVG